MVAIQRISKQLARFTSSLVVTFSTEITITYPSSVIKHFIWLTLHLFSINQLTSTTMRFSAVLPVLLGLASFILTMLCLFAGSKKGFMEDYAVVTLNTSQLGQTLLNDSETTTSSNPLKNLYNEISNSIESEINDGIGSLAREIGIHDWYSAHILDFCEGKLVQEPPWLL